jgi:DNA repair photolyase
MAEVSPRPSPLPVNFDQIPGELRYFNQWVLWRYVWKEGKDGKPGKWDKPPFQANGKLASSTAAHTWSTFKTVEAVYKNGLNLPVDDPAHFDGVGFVPHVVGKADLQIVFGDLDKCRDKETGAISPEALQDLQSLNTYSEPSPTGTGLRFVARGAPPFPPGKAGRKKGHTELYQGDHYLTITGQRLPEYPATIEKRPEELNAFYQKHFSEPEPEQPKEEAQKGNGTKLTDDQVIALAAQAHNSPKFLSLMDGKYEHFLKENGERLYPSQSDADLALCQLIAFYTPDPAQIDRVFRRSKLYREKWDREDYSQSTISLAIERTTEHYSGPGACGKKPKPETGEPCFPYVTKNDPPGTVGVSAETGEVQRVVIRKNPETDETFTALNTLSDCALRIDTETVANGETEYIFKGIGAVDKREVRFTMPAGDMAVPAKFKAAVINAFGGENKVGKLTYPIVQDLSCSIRHMQRVVVPSWKENIPLVPGVGLIENVEYRLSSKIPAAVYAGDLDKAKDCLRKLLKVHKFAPLLVATILGSPAIARWHRNDRFGLGLWGLTGTLKTATVLATLGIFGIGYLDSPKLKAGRGGSTIVGAAEIFAAAGFLPQLFDNVKAVDSKDAQNYVSTIHAVLEGEEKARGKKDGGLRESREFTCTPIITGEVRPQEASTSARVLNLNWSGANGPLLTEVQSNAALLPVIGYHWLRFLAETNFVLGKDFETFRSTKMEEFLGLKYTNPGRLAAIYTLLVATWDLLESSPIGDVFTEARESFKAALLEATATQGAAVGEETEIARFLAALEELIASNPGLIQSENGKKTIMGAIIGKWMPEGLFLLPTETLNELMKIKAFNQQPTIDSITQALSEKDLLIIGEDRHLKSRQRINGARPRGWYIKPEAVPLIPKPVPHGGDAENDSCGQSVPTVPASPQKKKENIFDENLGSFRETQKEMKEMCGDSGDSGDREREKREIDSDFSGKVSVPTSGPTEEKSGDKDAKCGIGPHPRKDEPTPAKLKAISYPKREALEYAKLGLNLHLGCSHRCSYCYNRSRFNGSCDVRSKKASFENIEADLKALAAEGNRDLVHFTFIGDPYDLGRQDNSEVRAVLELFKKYNHPFQVLTKGGTKAVQDFDLYGPNDRFGGTLTFINDVDSLRWEPGAALPGDRIEALRQAHSKHIKTWVSLEPVIDPSQTLALIEATHEFVDHYGVGKWNHDARANEIDWPKFRADAEAILKKYGKSYMIKDALRKAAPDKPTEDEPAPVDTSEQIRVAAISEFGMGGWVDPAKLAHALKIPLDVVEAWLQVNYVAYDRPNGGGIGYRQRRAGEAKA